MRLLRLVRLGLGARAAGRPVDAAEEGLAPLHPPDPGEYTAKRADLVASAEKVFSMVATGVIKPGVRQRYALADAVKAHVDLEAGRTTGSSLLIP